MALSHLQPEAVLSSLSQAGLLPSPVIPATFQPSVQLSVSFSEKQVAAGNLFRVSEVQSTPIISFTPEVRLSTLIFRKISYCRTIKLNSSLSTDTQVETRQSIQSCWSTPMRRRRKIRNLRIGVTGLCLDFDLRLPRRLGSRLPTTLHLDQRTTQSRIGTTFYFIESPKDLVWRKETLVVRSLLKEEALAFKSL